MTKTAVLAIVGLLSSTILCAAPVAAAPAKKARALKSWWMTGQLHFSSSQGTLEFQSIPCPASTAFHIKALHVVPTHGPLSASARWDATFGVGSGGGALGLGYRVEGMGHSPAIFEFPAPIQFRGKVGISFRNAAPKGWKYFTVAVLGSCRAPAPVVPTNES